MGERLVGGTGRIPTGPKGVAATCGVVGGRDLLYL